MVTADPVSRTLHDRLAQEVRALKAQLTVGLPILGIVLAGLVPTVRDGKDPAVALSATIG